MKKRNSVDPFSKSDPVCFLSCVYDWKVLFVGVDLESHSQPAKDWRSGMVGRARCHPKGYNMLGMRLEDQLFLQIAPLRSGDKMFCQDTLLKLWCFFFLHLPLRAYVVLGSQVPVSDCLHAQIFTLPAGLRLWKSVNKKWKSINIDAHCNFLFCWKHLAGHLWPVGQTLGSPSLNGSL